MNHIGAYSRISRMKDISKNIRDSRQEFLSKYPPWFVVEYPSRRIWSSTGRQGNTRSIQAMLMHKLSKLLVSLSHEVQKSPRTSAGWWFQPLWKIWKSMGLGLSHILWKIKNVPNHQPECVNKHSFSLHEQIVGSAETTYVGNPRNADEIPHQGEVPQFWVALQACQTNI